MLKLFVARKVWLICFN